jgi:predicted metal-dependent hydrolase
MQQIKLGDTTVEVVHKDIKHMNLSVYPPTGHVRISAPRRLSDDIVRVFAISKLNWIKKHQQRQRTQAREPAREYIDRESHYYLGKRYLLKVLENSGPSTVVPKHSILEVHVNGTATRDRTKDVLEAWYRRRLKEIVPEHIKKWEERLRVNVKFFGIKKMKTRWGTCNAKAGRIWINLELAKKPVDFLDYIVLHEAIHLLERKHNETFTAYMDKFLPKWRFYKEELNRSPLRQENWLY